MNLHRALLTATVFAAGLAFGCNGAPQDASASAPVAAPTARTQSRGGEHGAPTVHTQGIEPVMCDAYGNCEPDNPNLPPPPSDGSGSVDTGVYGPDCGIGCEQCNERCNGNYTYCWDACATDDPAARTQCHAECGQELNDCRAPCPNM